MLFRKDIEPRCYYCKYGKELNEDQVACPKKGVVSPGYHCGRFVYDPFKRTPPQRVVPDFSKYKEEDFVL